MNDFQVYYPIGLWYLSYLISLIFDFFMKLRFNKTERKTILLLFYHTNLKNLVETIPL